MSASVPPAKACRRGHSSTLWSSFVRQAGHVLPLADDPEAGGPAAGGSASVGGGPAFSSGLCFFGLGAADEDELEEEEDDEAR